MKTHCIFLSIAVLFSILAGAAQAQEAPEGLLLYLSFDEGTGNIAGDFSGHGNDGELVDGPTWVDGHDGKALEFDGQGSYV